MWFGGGSWRSQRYTLATEIWPRALGCTPSWPWPPTWYPSRGTHTGDAAHAGAQDGTGARCSPGATGHARRAAEDRGTAGGVSRYPVVTGRHGRSGSRPEPGNDGRALVKIVDCFAFPCSQCATGRPCPARGARAPAAGTRLTVCGPEVAGEESACESQG